MFYPYTFTEFPSTVLLLLFFNSSEASYKHPPLNKFKEKLLSTEFMVIIYLLFISISNLQNTCIQVHCLLIFNIHTLEYFVCLFTNYQNSSVFIFNGIFCLFLKEILLLLINLISINYMLHDKVGLSKEESHAVSCLAFAVFLALTNNAVKPLFDVWSIYVCNFKCWSSKN